MQLITRAVQRGDMGGKAIAMPYPSIKEELGMEIRAGEISMIAGEPGSGKSTLAMSIALKANVPTLYMCADTSAWTIGLRVGACLTGYTQDHVEQMMLKDAAWLENELTARECVPSAIWWEFEPSPSVSDIIDSMNAYAELYGRFPELVVVDNLVDVSEGEEEFSALRATIKELKVLAKNSGAAVLLLHHTSEAVHAEGEQPPPRHAIQGKVNQLPAAILTVRTEDGIMCIASVKNRNAGYKSDGSQYVRFRFDGSTMQIVDPRMRNVRSAA